MSATVSRASGPSPRRDGVLRVGTRGSALAVAQTTTVAELIAKTTGLDVEIVTVTTHGDTSRESLSELGGRACSRAPCGTPCSPMSAI